MEKDTYKDALNKDKQVLEQYLLKSYVKTEQQKFLEELLINEHIEKCQIADIACGGGSLSYHLSKKYLNSYFTLVDNNNSSIDICRKNLSGPQFKIRKGDIYSLNNLKNNFFDFVFCWQTLSWLENPEMALSKLLDITKPGGKLYISSLFNLKHDVDIYSKVYDHTRESSKEDFYYNYNTFCYKTIKNWLNSDVSDFKIHSFTPKIDFEYTGSGIGTYTINSEKGRLQISGGLLLNWGVLEIKK